MHQKIAFLIALAFVACASPQVQQSVPPPPPATTAPPVVEDPKPPIAKKVPQVRNLHGEKFVDDYFWLREKGSSDVAEYLQAESAYSSWMMKRFAWLEDDLYQKIVSHIAEDDESVPAKDGNWLYWTKVEKGKNYPKHLRKKTDGSSEELILDVNALAEGKTFLQLGEFVVSDDGNWLAYSTDETGFRQYRMQFKDLRTGVLSPEAIERVVMATFAADNKTVFYVVEDDSKRPYRLYRHTIGTEPAKDVLLLEEKDGRFEQYVWRMQSKNYIVACAESKLANEIRLFDAKDLNKKPILIRPRSGEIKYYPEQHRDRFIIRVNDTGKNFRLAWAPIGNPAPRQWRPMREHDPKVMLDDFYVFSDFMVMLVREDGLPHLEVQNFAARTVTRIRMPEPDYDVSLSRVQNREYQTTKLRYSYESMSTPDTLYELDIGTNAVVQLKQQPVPGFDRANYTTERISAKASDGTEIPISIVYKNGFIKDGSAPLHLTAYGSYGISYESWFSPALLALLDRGVVYAVAHVRGGGELGKVWHEKGRLAHKMNTFTDFIACAEHLLELKYTSKERLTIEGQSAGGLLIGAVTNMRPDLFKAVIADVPFVDVLNTMNDPSIPLTITEYEEWGNPQKKEQYRWIRTYSPYDNVEAKAYPAILVKSSVNDSQVPYWESAKYVAKLRALKTDQNPLLFKIHLDEAGHGGKSGRYEQYRDVAADYAFVLWQDGVVK